MNAPFPRFERDWLVKALQDGNKRPFGAPLTNYKGAVGRLRLWCNAIARRPSPINRRFFIGMRTNDGFTVLTRVSTTRARARLICSN